MFIVLTRHVTCYLCVSLLNTWLLCCPQHVRSHTADTATRNSQAKPRPRTAGKGLKLTVIALSEKSKPSQRYIINLFALFSYLVPLYLFKPLKQNISGLWGWQVVCMCVCVEGATLVTFYIQNGDAWQHVCVCVRACVRGACVLDRDKWKHHFAVSQVFIQHSGANSTFSFNAPFITFAVKSSTGKLPSSANKKRPVSAYLVRPTSGRPPPAFDTSKTKRKLDLIERDLKLTTKALQERLGISRQGLVWRHSGTRKALFIAYSDIDIWTVDRVGLLLGL